MRVGLISGSGQFPLIFSRKAKQRGYHVFAAAHINETDKNLESLVDGIEWLHLGQINRLIRFFKKNDVDQAIMAGAIKKTRMFKDIRPDRKAFSLVGALTNSHDDGVLRAFADLLEKEGIQILASTFLLPELLAPEGCWTRRKPSRFERQQMELGWGVAKAVGNLDIGQCVVVGGGSVLAVEAIDGTDETIRRGGRLGSGEAIVVKVCKPKQDVRFDMPAVGAKTIQTMSQSGVRALAVEAGKAVVFDREAMVELADHNQIAIVGMKGVNHNQRP